MPINGPALGALGIGSLFLYSAIKGKSILASAQAIITGQSPQTVKQTNPIAQNTPDSSGTSGGTISAGGIAGDAMKYSGHAYLYGGAPGLNGQNPWDCSSFCNWVVGHDAGMAIPGYGAGKYDGSVHGPATLSWIVFGKGIGSNPANAQPGDLCVWQTHMGIAIGNGQMISALNPSLKTIVSSIPGGAPPGELLSIRRL